jgi:hypothetical protein
MLMISIRSCCIATLQRAERNTASINPTGPLPATFACSAQEMVILLAVG